MTKHEAAVMGAFTGILCGDFSDMHCYIEKIMQRPVFTHEMANKDTMQEIKDKARNDFINICENLTNEV